MKMDFLKKVEGMEILKLENLIEYLPNQIASMTLSQNKHHSLTLFAFDEGEEISSHESDGDAMVIALDGVGKITIDSEEYILNAGETIIMPAKRPHAVYAQEKFKMFLIVIFD